MQRTQLEAWRQLATLPCRRGTPRWVVTAHAMTTAAGQLRQRTDAPQQHAPNSAFTPTCSQSAGSGPAAYLVLYQHSVSVHSGCTVVRESAVQS